MNLVPISHKLVYNLLLRTHARNVFCRHLPYPLNHPLRTPAKRLKQRAMPHRRIRAREREEIRHVRACERKIRLGFVLPLLRKRDTVAANYVEGGHLRNIEAGCADDDIELVKGAVIGVNAGFGNVCNRAVGEVYIWLYEGLEVTVAGRHASAANFPFWDQLLAEDRVMVEFGGHLLTSEFLGGFVEV